MAKPSPPKAPDPVALSNAQGAANADTARLQAQLNNVNQYGPYGSVTYERNGDQWSQYIRPSDDVLQQVDATVDAQNQALGVANRQIGRVDQALSTPLSLEGLPNLESEAIEPNLYGWDALSAPQLSGNFGYGAQGMTPAYPGRSDGGGGPAIGGQRYPGPGAAAGAPVGQGSGGSAASGGGLPPIQAVQGSVGTVPLQMGFNPGQSVQGQVGPTDFTADRNAVTDAVFNQARSRLDPMFQQQDAQLRNRLANQGLSQNSAAYQNATADFNRDRNDAYNQALYSGIQQGAAEQNQLFGQRLQQGQFANQAAGQQYAQNQGQAGFYNQGANQMFNNALQAGQFGNQAAAQQFQQGLTATDFANQVANQNFQNQQASLQGANAVRQQGFANQVTNMNATNQSRQQALQERAYLQNQPLNQLTALMGLNQVQLPQGAQQGNTQVSPTDVLGAYALNQQQKNANYQNAMGMYGGALGGLFNLGSSAIMASDRRLKRDIVRLGKVKGINWYAFRYVGRPELCIGVIAQEIRKVKPWAVEKIGPWLAVNYALL